MKINHKINKFYKLAQEATQGIPSASQKAMDYIKEHAADTNQISKEYNENNFDLSPERKKEYENYFNLIKELQYLGEQKSDPFDSDSSENKKMQLVEDKINKIEMFFTDEQNKEIEEFEKKEEEEKAAKEKSIAGKSVFSTADAQKILQSFINKMKPLLQGQMGVLTFYNNGNVGISSPNIKGANTIRNRFILDLEMALKQYLLYNKKYFDKMSISINI